MIFTATLSCRVIVASYQVKVTAFTPFILVLIPILLAIHLSSQHLTLHMVPVVYYRELK